MAKRSIENRARVFTGLGEPTRLRIADLLSKKNELSGTDLAEELGVSLALLCHHAKVMTDAGILRKRRQGQATYYSFDADFVRDSMQFGSIRRPRHRVAR